MTAFDRIPPEILCAADYESLARERLPSSVYAYIAGGSGRERSLQANLDALSAPRIVPRLLRDVTAGHTRFELWGRSFRHPVFLAPVAFQKLVHPDGEIATARAAGAVEACLLASTLASCSLEEMALAAGPDKWFQLYFQPTREATADLVRRAEAAGYAAIVATLDTSVQAPSLRSRRAGFAMPDHVRQVNLDAYPRPGQCALAKGESLIFQGMMREAPTWKDLEWLLRQTSLPVVVKGVLHAQDARLLREAGAAGVIVSNHGGRSLDGVPATLDALPWVREAVGADYPVLFDGGIRSGSDVFMAIAHGANAVLVGRLQVYALAVAGALGVAHMIRSLREELEFNMALAGCATLAEITPESIFVGEENIC